MSADQTQPTVRERTWVEKFDHTVEPPRLVERVFVETVNGVVSETTVESCADDAASVDSPVNPTGGTP